MDGVGFGVVTLHKIDGDDVDSHPRTEDVSPESVHSILFILRITRAIGENEQSLDVLLSASELTNLLEGEVDSGEDISSRF